MPVVEPEVEVALVESRSELAEEVASVATLAAEAVLETGVAEVTDSAAESSEVATSEALAPVGLQDERPMLGVDWTSLKQQVHDCTACVLRAGCTQTVFGVGDENAEWLFVGEGPGMEEDEQGEPFVGPAGRLLDNMLAAIKLKRGENVYIANVIKCCPAANQKPHVGEIATCLPYLQQQIALLKPKLIVALGKTAATALLGSDATLGSLRGTLHDYHGTPLIVTYHPAYLLRSPSEKAKAWQDLCFAMQQMAE